VRLRSEADLIGYVRAHSFGIEQAVGSGEAEAGKCGMKYANGYVRPRFSRIQQAMVDRVSEVETSLWGGHTPLLLLPSPEKVSKVYIVLERAGLCSPNRLLLPTS